MLDAQNTEITREGGERAMQPAPEGATSRPPALETTEIRGDAGRQATQRAPERAIVLPPADENTGATAPEQEAANASPARARRAPPSAEDPGPAGRDGAIYQPPKRARVTAPRHDDPVLIEDSGQTGRDRFADPLVAEITELWRLRQAMVEGQRKLILQAKSICRRFTQGDKAEAEKLWTAIAKGREHPLADLAAPALIPFLQAQDPLVAQRKAFEKRLAKLGKQLPIANVADGIKGVNSMTLATIVGELGDLSAYEKGIAGIWKRAGLAVIDGERQRLKTGDAALLHAYSPSRRSVFWNIGGALIKAQGTDGPYRAIYDARKGYELERGIPKAHAHNRAMRHMTKRLLKDLWQEWKAAS